MSTALLADHEFGALPRWPLGAVSVANFFDRPVWERPSPTRPYVEPDGSVIVYEGTPGFGGTGQSGPSGGLPGFQGGTIPGGSAWAPSGTTNGGTISVFGGNGVVSIDVEPSRLQFYNIEVHDTDGELLTRVPDWLSGTLKLQMGEASTLVFRIPVDSEAAAELVRPNSVWLRDRWGFVIETFQIQRRRPSGRGDTSYIEIECQSVIAQLGEEVVLRYEGAELPVIDHVTALLELQAKAGPLTLGTVDPEIADIELPYFAEDTNILAALLSLQMALPKATRGNIYVDPQRRVQWRLAIGDLSEQIITRQRNVYAVDAEVDYSRIVNRIYMYGEGNDTRSRLSLVDAGEAEEYIEDAGSITAHGLCPFLKVDRRIRNPETLLSTAQRILDEFSEPPVVVSVDLLDLAKSDSAPTGWEDIFIGGKYRVVDSNLALDTSIEIVGIELDLTKPVPLRVDLANQTRELSDFISQIIDATQQPLDVDGDRYPTMGRNYTSSEPREARAGDVRWNDAESKGQMHDGTDWQDMGGGDELHHTASTKSGLPSAGSVNVASIGRVDGGGADNGMFCVPNPAKNGWDALNFFE